MSDTSPTTFVEYKSDLRTLTFLEYLQLREESLHADYTLYNQTVEEMLTTKLYDLPRWGFVVQAQPLTILESPPGQLSLHYQGQDCNTGFITSIHYHHSYAWPYNTADVWYKEVEDYNKFLETLKG